MSNSNKFTPGPWNVANDSQCLIYAKIMTVDGTPVEPLVAQVSRYTTSAQANATLIAAAPEMLEALERHVKLLESIERETGYCTRVTQDEAYKLIAKARGES